MMKTLFTLVTLFFCYTICWGQQKQLMVKMVNGKPQVVKVGSQLSVPFASKQNKKTISSQSVPYPARTQKFSNSTTNSAPQNSLLVKDINPNTVDVYAGSDPALYHNFNNNPSYPDTGVAIPGGPLFFPAYNYNGTELWQTDGTDAGTVITKDIASGGSYNDSYPMFLQAMGSDLFFFTAEYNFNNGGFTNYRLRKRDGTTGIINEGSLTDYPFDTVFNVMQANGYIFFLGVETNQYSYYFTNGKTALIKFDPSNNQYEIISTDNPTQMYAFDNYLIFDADDGIKGREPWKYNFYTGTTDMLFDINQNNGGAASSNPHDFIGYHNTLFYTADDGTGKGMQIKTADLDENSNFYSFSGTDLDPADANPRNKIVFNDNIYFRINNTGNNTFDIYKLNGDYPYFFTNEVTTDYNANNGAMAVANNHLLFAADDGDNHNQLWQTDVDGNTSRVGDANINDGDDANPSNFTVLNNKLLFVANDGGAARNIWQTDGNNASLVITTPSVNHGFYDPTIFGVNSGFAYFFMDGGTYGREIWKTDGTTANTAMVSDINKGDNNSIGSNIVAMELFKGQLYFGANTADGGNRVSMYKTDGTPGGTVEAFAGADVVNGGGIYFMYGDPSQIKAVGNTLYFVANNFGNGNELWKTDGTAAGTSMVKDINARISNPNSSYTDNSDPRNLIALNGKLYFTANDGINNNQLWVSDGTDAGTHIVKDINGTNDPNIFNIVADSANNRLFFSANDGTHGAELWVSDGTDAGTHMVKDINMAGDGSPNALTMFKGKVYFLATNAAYGTEPWMSDGTEAGTTILKDIAPGPLSSWYNFGSYLAFSFAPLGSYLYFTADSTNNGGGLSTVWRTDGTPLGTKSFVTAANPVFCFNFGNMGNKVTFIAYDQHGAAIYTTDGTDAGTLKVSGFGDVGVGGFGFLNFVTFKNHYFTWTTDNVHGNEMWQTDGTVAGSFVTDIAPGQLSSYPINPKGLNGLLFPANDGSYAGNELWRLNVSASITWLSFTATKNLDTTVTLNWATASETNNKGFIVQRSVDNIHFDSLGFVAAASPNGATYSFIDHHPVTSVNYYRLAQVDNAGTIEYSNVEQVFIYAPLKGGLIKSSETLCTGVLPSKMVDSVAVSGGQNTAYTYQWQDSVANKKWHKIPDSVFATYQPQALNITTYFRRIVYAGADSAISNTLVKTYAVAPGDTSVAPTNAWNVYVFGGTDLTLSSAANSPYYGYYTTATSASPNYGYDTRTDWSPYPNPDPTSSTTAIFNGCPLVPTVYSFGNVYFFTIDLKRKNFTPGNYVLNLASYTGHLTVLVDHAQIFSGTGGSNPTVSLGALSANSVVEIRMSNVISTAYLNFTLFQSDLKPGDIGGTQNICPQQQPGGLYNNNLAYGGPAPQNITYQWQDSLKGTPGWQNIAGATNSYYVPPILADTTYFRRAAADGQSTVVYTNTVVVNINVVKDVPTITSVGRVLYVNLVPGVYNVKWFRNGTQISGATDATYTATLAGTYTAKFQENCGDGPLSNAVTFANDAQTQTINFAAPANLMFGTSPFIKLMGMATSGLGITYNINYGPATISNDTIYITGTGNVSITASQPGNLNYTPATSITQIFTISAGSQTITFTPISNKKYGDAPFVMNASSSAGLGVGYTIVSGPANVSGNTVTLTGAGTVTVKASQGGNGNYNAAPDVQTSFCVGINQISAIKGDTTVCPSTYKYAVDSITGGLFEWGVSGGGTVTIKGDTAIVTWQTPGDYILYAKGYSACDATKSATSSITVHVATVVLPTPVTNMFPANGTQNLQLPLTLSWIPGANTTSYDLYVWNAGASKPATPYATGITGVNYTLPNVGFPYNTTYKWSVTSHNPCSQVDGPTQTFGLIPLPDLAVSNIQVPATAFSGQNVAITWKVTNNGPGITNLNQRWSDAIFLSFDSMPNFTIPPQTNPGAWSQLDFPIKPLLVAAVSNVSALNVGESYTNSYSFKLPLYYNFPIYAYVITNYSPTATSPLEVTLLNDTAHAPVPIQVTLSPTPDLRVDSVVTPSVIFSGSTINVTYKVKNYGVVTPVGNTWKDKVYISKDALFNITTALPLNAPKANGTFYYNAPLAEFGYNTQLQQDSFYTRSVPVVIPNFIQGAYYIYVVTDAGNTVYEGSLDNNNMGSSLTTIFLTPTPTLTVASLSTPSTASTTQPININWNIKNQGFYDNLQKNQGHYLDTVQYCGYCYTPYCIPGYYIDGQGNYHAVPCPGAQVGYSVKDSLGFGSSNWSDALYLSTDSSGLNVSNAMSIGTYAHSNPNEVNFDFDNATSLPHLQYNGLVFQAGQPYLGVYSYYGIGLPAGANPSNYNVNTTNAISPNSNFAGTYGYTVPDNLPQGTYYIYVLSNANKGVYEYPVQQQTRRSAAITIARPDVSVPSVTVPATGASGQQIFIGYQLLNSGPGGVYNHVRTDYVYMSSSSVFDGNAQLIATPNYTENLPLNVAVSHTVNYKLPIDASGTRYFFVRTNVDSAFRENNYNNNINTTAASINITLTPAPNLIVSGITVPTTVPSVTGFPFVYTIPNQGPGVTTGSWTDSIYVSCSPTFSTTTAYGVAARQHSNSIPSGSSYTDSFTLSIPFTFDISSCFGAGNPSSAGYFFVKTNAGNALYEGANTGDNITGTSIRTIVNPLVDQIVTSVIGGDTASVGKTYPVYWTVKNIGQNPGTSNYNAWDDAVYVSTDSVFNSNATLATYFVESHPLNNNQTYSASGNATIPNLNAGDYYVFVNTNNYNNIHGELNLTNNNNLVRNADGTAKKIHVIVPPQPDLVDSIVLAAATVATGQPLGVKLQVKNIGAGATFTNSWTDGFYLSSDYIPGNAGDIFLGSFAHGGALQPNQSYIDSFTLPINMNVSPGNYILIAKTNANGNLFESNTNNNLSFRYITVYTPPPTDLIVTNISHPDTVLLGYPDSTTWNLYNQSGNPANGVETDGIYLSKNNALDSAATLIGTIQNKLNLLPVSLDTIQLAPLVQGVTEGNYYMIVKTDILNNIVETNRDNNTTTASKQVFVKVKQLPLNTTLADNLQSTTRYYKLIIPDSLKGATILLTLKSNDSLTVNNQLYVGLGYVPTAAKFDYAYGNPNFGNQQILMPSVSDSVYYITVLSTTSNPPVQQITLTAVNLPFAIVSVDAKSGGNTGKVTVKITGSLFTTGMVAKLQNAGATITADTVYYINSTSVYATFNLQGKALGMYNVILTKQSDQSSTTLANGFTIENPNNGGLITGGGTNTGQTGSGNAPGCDPGAKSGLNAQLQTDIVIPPKVFVGWPFTIQINFSNPTNVDIPAQTRVLYSLDGVPIALTKDGIANGATSLYIEFSEQNGPPGIIRAGGTGTIYIYSKTPTSYPGHKDINFNLK